MANANISPLGAALSGFATAFTGTQKARAAEELATAEAAKYRAEAILGPTIPGEVGQRLAIYNLQKAGYPPEVINDMMNRYIASTNLKRRMAELYGVPTIGKQQTWEDIVAGRPQPGLQPLPGETISPTTTPSPIGAPTVTTPPGEVPTGPTYQTIPVPGAAGAARDVELGQYLGLPAGTQAQPGAPGQTLNDGSTALHNQIKNDVNTARNNPTALTPQQTFRLGQIRAAEQKSTSDPDTRQQALALSSIIKTYDSVNIKAISKYAGLIGAAKRQEQSLRQVAKQAGFDVDVDPDYYDYKTFAKLAKGMTDQLRKALGTSIRNEYVKTMLLPMVDTIQETWGSDPQLAEQTWRWLGNWLKSYSLAYYDAINRGVPPSELKNTDIVSQTPNLQMAPPGYYRGSDGKWYSKEELQKLARGKK